MHYQEAVAYLEALADHERLGFRRHMADLVSLDTMRALAALLGDPHLGLRFVHIAGSKGKGSVAALVESILRAAGYATGLFTSPHLVSPRERLRLNGQPVAERELAQLVALVRPAVEELRASRHFSPATFFEAYTAMALVAFARHRVQVAIMETGLGGRLDATNIISPQVCALTTLCLEHTDVLGPALTDIAREKAGILKPAVPVVLAPQPPEAQMVILERAREVGAPVHPAPPAQVLARPLIGPDDPPSPQLIQIGTAGRRYHLSLLGDHQAQNAAVAVGMVQLLTELGLPVPEQAIQIGLREVRWPGRLQVAGQHPRVVLDCAHAPRAAAALASALRTYFRFRRLLLVVGMSEDKDVQGFAAALAALNPQVFLCRADLPRALPAEELRRRAGAWWQSALVCTNVPHAVEAALAAAHRDDLVCITGSVYVVGEAMQHLGLPVC
jgi:dihydrofolate synthase/folylpolyglutamate synthase